MTRVAIDHEGISHGVRYRIERIDSRTGPDVYVITCPGTGRAVEVARVFVTHADVVAAALEEVIRG